MSETNKPDPTPFEDEDDVFSDEVEITDDVLTLDGEIEAESEPLLDEIGDDDDNAYQESDEALPDELEEHELLRNPSRERSADD